MSDLMRIFDNGNGTCSVKQVLSFNTAEPMAAGELGRKDFNYPLPDCPARYYSWNGSDVVEAGQEVKDAIDATIAAKLVTDKKTRAADMVKDALVKALTKIGNEKWAAGKTVTLEEVEKAIEAEL